MELSGINIQELIVFRSRRIFAFIVDILFVIAIGGVVGSIFRSTLIEIGSKTYYIGFFIALLYHGLTNSFLLKGQTLGKIIFNLKVVTSKGVRISPLLSLLRSFILIIGFFEEYIRVPYLWEEVLIYIIYPIVIAMLYLMFFSSDGRLIHDYICGTYVVDKGTSVVSQSKIQYRHLIIIGVISAVLLVGRLFLPSNKDIDKNFVNTMDNAHTQILQLSDVKNASIQFENDNLSIIIETNKSPIECHKLAVISACEIIGDLGLENSNKLIHLIIVRGYDLGIYQSWEKYSNTYSAKEWLSESNRIKE
jgi:uncharacterized RDD family membrane protein YckC